MMKKKLLAIFAAFVLLTAMFTNVYAAVVIPTTVTAASDGCMLLGYPGKYIVDAQNALNRINEIRYEACREGVINPSTNKALTLSDYVAIKWSSDLEYVARIRAAEASISLAHERLNGESIWFSSPNGVSNWGEVLAWNWSDSMIYGIDQWYGEKSDWVNKTGAVTGHYEALIDPENLYVGLATFCSENAPYYNSTAGEFSFKSGLDESFGTISGDCIQALEVKNEYISDCVLNGKTQFQLGGVDKFSISASVTFDSVKTEGLQVLGGVKWLSSNPALAAVDENGNITAQACGTAQITAELSNGTKLTKNISVLGDGGKINITNSLDGKIKKLSGGFIVVSPDVTVAELLSALTEGVKADSAAQKPYTGMVISLVRDGEIADSITLCVKGDVDGDSDVTAADARLALRQSVNLEKLSGAYLEAANVDGEKVSASDARMILRASVNLEKPQTLLGRE